MKKFISILFITFIPQKVFSQNFLLGEVITLKGDTLRGFVKAQSDAQNAKSCIFSLSMKGKDVISYSPKEITSYKIYDEKFYIAKDVPFDIKETLFLEYLVNGIVDLYYLKKGMNEYFLMEKENKITILNNNKSIITQNGITFEKYSNQYKNMMQLLFEDSQFTKINAKKTRFFAEDMIDITKQYHNEVCSEYACLDYTKPFRKSVSFEIGIGGNFSNMKLANTDFNQDNFQPQLNIGLKYIDLRKYRKFNFRTGLSFSKNSYETRFEYELFDPRTRVMKMTLDYLTIRLPIIIEANFKRKKIVSPYLSIGLSPIYLASLKYNLVRRFSNEGTIPEQFENLPIKFRRMHYGIHFTSGFYLKINTKTYILFTCPIESRKPIVKSGHIFDYQKHFSIQPSIALGFVK